MACPKGTSQGKPATCKQGAMMPQAARMETRKSWSHVLCTQAAGGCALERGTTQEALRGSVLGTRVPGKHHKETTVRNKVRERFLPEEEDYRDYRDYKD